MGLDRRPSREMPRFSLSEDGATAFQETAQEFGGQEAWQQATDAGKTVLNYDQWVQARTTEFKQWFGDWENDGIEAEQEGADAGGVSEVNAKTNARAVGKAGRVWRLDPATGEPRVFHHGTRDSFTEFDLNIESSKDHGWLGTSVYVISERRLAESYSRLKSERPLVKMPPQEVAINPIPDDAEPSVTEQGVNSPTLQRAILKAI